VKRGSKDKPRVKSSPVGSADRPCDIENDWLVAGLALLTWLLSLPIFEPQSVGLVAGITFVPWTAAVCLARRARRMYLVSYLLGAAFFLTHLRWLYTTTGPGYVAAALYLAAYFPLAAWPVRYLYRDRRISPTFALPIAWVAWELVRSKGLLEFPWFLAGHTQARRLLLIQIADLGGAYGVSFVVMMVNGWLAERVMRAIQVRRGRKNQETRLAAAVSTVVLLVVVGGTVLYGHYRLSYSGTTTGPRIAVLQGDYLLSATSGLDSGPRKFRQPENDEIDRELRRLGDDGDDEADKRLTYLSLIEKCAAESPDIMVLPETPWWMYLNRELRELPQSVIDEERDSARRAWLELCWKVANAQHREFQALARKHDCYLVVGALSEERQPPGKYPAEHRYNSAFVYSPDGSSEPMRYDKIHLVVFGEYVPFRYSPHFFWLYRFLNDGWWNPWGRGGREYSLTRGTEHTVFSVKPRSMGDRQVRFGVTICYEDVIPEVFRGFMVGQDGGKGVDFMLNISNDGWFGHGTQQAQHLANCAFRAVENRVSVARAVNTGVSGFINSSGSWYSLVGASDRDPQVGGEGYRVDEIQLDPRVTFYSRYGDLFALTCVGLVVVAVFDCLVVSRLLKQRSTKKRGLSHE